MSQQKKPQAHRLLTRILVAAVLVSIATSVTLAIKLHNVEHQQSTTSTTVQLGGLNYTTTSSGKIAVKHDPLVDSLRSFLAAAAQKDIQLGCASSYYIVRGWTTDEKQVLVNYGCSYPNAYMYVVNTNSTWQFVSPTNEFNALGIPVCSYVNQNGISNEIAPICVNDGQAAALTLTHQYQVR